ncbi:MAG TPA: AMP-binding protein, partial [Thermoanaerobaculaceae bacterium]|nr:AMP-binding protein [Thermoanaerobaculaceae bacterium]
MRELSVTAAAREGWDTPALVFGDESWSWVELARRVTAEMAALGRLGLGRPGGPPRVRLVARATPELVVRLLALVQLGVTVVPLHARWTSAERAAVAALDPVAWDLDSLPATTRPARFLPLVDHRKIPPGRPLAVVFTSGSSAEPKGVILSRAAFVASAAAGAARLGWQA